jgi:hypothetical protein
VRRKPGLRPASLACGLGLERAVSLGNAGSLHDSGIPNLKLNSAMKEFLAGRVPIAYLPTVRLLRSPLCPICVLPRSTAFDFSSFFNVPEQPFVRAIFLLSYCWSCMFLRFAATCVS